MIGIWLSLIGTLLVQEPASTGAALLFAYRNGFHIWVIHGLWLILVTSKIIIGYSLGLFVRKLFSRSKVGHWAKKIGEHFKYHVPKSGRRLAFGLLGLLTFTWSPSFIASWIEFPFWTTMICLLLGNFTWYCLEWAIVLGAGALAANLMVAIVIVVGAGLVVGLILNAIRNKTQLIR